MKTNIGNNQDQEANETLPNVPEKTPVDSKPSKEDESITFASDVHFQDAVAKAVAALDGRGGKPSPASKRKVLQDDLLKERKHLVARAKWYQINGYSIYGEEVLAPNGAITFNDKWYYYMQGKDTVTYCIAEIGRKSDWEYIKEHPLFGIKFFEKKSEALNGSLDVIDRRAAALMALSKLNPDQLERKAMYYNTQGANIDMSIDTKGLMLILAKLEADNTTAQAKKSMEETINRSLGSQDFMSTGDASQLVTVE